MVLNILDCRALAKEIFQIDLSGDFPFSSAVPGQFLHILIDDGSTYVLRRPISIADIDPDFGKVSIVFRKVGKGTAWLSARQPGDKLDVLGPLGNGFPLPEAGSRILVVGGGIGVPPLYELSKGLVERNCNISIYLGFRSFAEAFWIERFQNLGATCVFSDDGSIGEQGLVTSGLDLQEGNWDFVYSCGPTPMLRGLQKLCAGTSIAGYMSVEERMACGVGACYGCACKSPSGEQKRVCVDGPVFSFQEVDLG